MRLRRLAFPGGLISVVGLVAVTQPVAGGDCSGTALASSPVNGGTVVSGRVSTFGPPGEAAGATASGNPGGDAAPGISLHVPGSHYSDAVNRALMGHWFHVVIGNHAADLQDIDLGPADYLNRAIDVTGAGARTMGIDPASFPTNAQGTATEIQAPGRGSIALVGAAPTPGCTTFASNASGPIINDAQLGPTTNPVPGSSPSRLDMGRDGTTQHFLAPFNGKITFSEVNDSGWLGGGYVAVQSSQNPSMCYYAAEGPTPIVRTGQAVQVGQEIATPRPSPYNGIVGNFEIGRCTPTSPSDPLAHNISNPRAMVLAFEAWLERLGVPATTDPSNAGFA